MLLEFSERLHQCHQICTNTWYTMPLWQPSCAAGLLDFNSQWLLLWRIRHRNLVCRVSLGYLSHFQSCLSVVPTVVMNLTWSFASPQTRDNLCFMQCVCTRRGHTTCSLAPTPFWAPVITLAPSLCSSIAIKISFPLRDISYSPSDILFSLSNKLFLLSEILWTPCKTSIHFFTDLLI